MPFKDPMRAKLYNRKYQRERYYTAKGIAYRKTDSFKKSKKIASRKYESKPEVKKKKAEYAKSEKARLTFNKYRKSERGIRIKKEWYNKWKKTARGQRILKKNYDIQKSRFPKKYIARYRLNNAIQYGFIKRPNTCSKCKKIYRQKRQIEAHHHKGYGKKNWYNVVWLCRKCHKMKDHTAVPVHLYKTPASVK